MVTAQGVTKPHVAFLPSPGMGHVVPLFEFAKHLVIHHNVHVSFLVINTDEASEMQNKLLQSSTLPAGLNVIDLPPVSISSCVKGETSVLTRITTICRESIKYLGATLVELGLPKALIIDMFTTDAFFVCKELGLPVYSFFTSTTEFLAFAFYVSNLKKEFVEVPELVQIPGCKSIGKDDFPDELLKLEGKQGRGHMAKLMMATGIFVNTWDDLELKSCWLSGINNDPFYKTLPAPPIYPIGPLIKNGEAVTDSDEYIMSWLNNQSPSSVLLVSLGSGGTLTSEQLTELALGLEMSEQKFVWVVRKPNDLSASASYFNVGCDKDDPLSYLPEGFLKRTAGVGLMVPSWAPQVSILRHEAIGSFLSHCGWNSTLESIVHGVPMIAWPLYAEQRMNATLLTEEIAVAVKPVAVSADSGGKNVVKREEVARVVRLLMESEEGKVMKDKANELKESAAKALKSGGSSYDLVSSIVKSWN